MAPQSWLRPERWVLAAVAFIACEQIGTLAQLSSQQNDSCPAPIQLTVNGTSSLSELYSYLRKAQNCSISISVDWNGIVEIDQSITVPSGAELRVNGGGFNGSYGGDAISSSSSSSSGGDDRSNAASVVRGNSGASLFIVREDGNLSISGMTLQNDLPGGRGIETFENSRVVSVDCLWDSLSAADSGGAISAKKGTTLTLGGTNVFSGCSSSSSGGAINLKEAVLIAQGDVRFENCNASKKGGGLNIQDNSLLQVAEAASVSFSGCTAGAVTGDTGGGLCSFTSTISVGANAKVLFENNSVAADGDGGGLYAKNSSITLNVTANMSFINNHAGDKGGGMYLQQINSDEYTGEVDMARSLVLAKGSNAMFINNSCGDSGGGVHFSTGCDVIIDGDVYFEENSGERAGAMYFDESRAVVSGRATFKNNTAERWGGAVMLIDSESGLKFNGPIAARDNSAGRSGGVLFVENAPLVVTADGGEDGVVWEGNSAGYDGGVISIDGGELHLEGGFATSNSAAQRGGVLFATGESLVSWTGGGSLGNSAASGGSMYISNSEFNLTDVRLEGDHTPSGAVVFLAGADARMVNTSIVGPEMMSGDFALHVDAHSMLKAFSCSFERWDGDAKVVMSEGELVLDACDFSQSSNELLVRALKPATIRNAVLGDENYVSAGNNASTVFGSDSQSCSDLPEEYSCLGSGLEEDCVDADYGMGVLCAAYVAAATGENVFLSGDGSSVELVATSAPSPSPSNVVYFPELVMQELTLRYPLASVEGNDSSNGDSSWEVEDASLWELRCSDGTEYGGSPTGNGFFSAVSADNFSWVAMPTSGVLLRGQEIMISFVGTPPPPQDPSRPSTVYNGEVSATFNVLSRSAEAESRTLSDSATFEVTFFYCTVGAYWDGQECVLCVELMSTLEDGDGSLVCDMPGVTLETLPLAAGETANLS